MSHRRRGVGVGRAGASKYAQKKADELKAISLQSALDTIEKLEAKLTEFAQKHQSEIQSDPVFRQRFLEMCGPLGVDPLASKKSFWGQLLGMGDFYHELAVQVAEVCLASRTRNGGIMSLAEVRSILKRRKTRLGSQAASTRNTKTSMVSQADVSVAISKLAQLGGGFRTVTVGKSTMVVSVPTELDHDHMTVMTAARNRSSSNGSGGVTVRQVQEDTKWTEDRVRRALDLLLSEGMAWIDKVQGETYYWFPSLWQEDNMEKAASSSSGNSTLEEYS